MTQALMMVVKARSRCRRGIARKFDSLFKPSFGALRVQCVNIVSFGVDSAVPSWLSHVVDDQTIENSARHARRWGSRKATCKDRAAIILVCRRWLATVGF